MSLNCSELRGAVLSDIHLGHRRNTTKEILQNLYAALPNDAETANLDIIFLAGDVFDDLLSLSDEDILDIDLWIAHLLRICKRHGIMLRVLEGTPGHDWKQSQRFEAINEVAEIGADLKYIKELSIEYVRDGYSVLYVPDEWNDTTDKTLSQVHDLLRAHGLDKVDMAIMHGQFEFQLPPHIKAQKHSSEAYLKLVRDLIFIGHVHIHSSFDRIVAQGSTDRLTHGEEAPKGHVRFTIRQNGDNDWHFVETINAKKFVTVRCIDMTLEDTLAEVDRKVLDLPETSFVRIEANHDNPIFSNMELLIRKYPTFTWSKLAREADEESKEVIEDETVYVPITLTRDNLLDLLLDRILGLGTPIAVVDAAHAILEEVL
jgi:DNA repair exonuclease SbcCD nuclease subunit